MVKYYGRAKSRIGSVNTNQPGLKMAGCPSKIGRTGRLDRYIGQRVNCNLKMCGYTRKNTTKQYRCRHGVNFILDSAGNAAVKAQCVEISKKGGGACVKCPQRPQDLKAEKKHGCKSCSRAVKGTGGASAVGVADPCDDTTGNTPDCSSSGCMAAGETCDPGKPRQNVCTDGRGCCCTRL